MVLVLVARIEGMSLSKQLQENSGCTSKNNVCIHPQSQPIRLGYLFLLLFFPLLPYRTTTGKLTSKSVSLAGPVPFFSDVFW